MKQHPMLFRPDEVCATVSGAKTQKRVLVKFPPDWDGETVYPNGQDGVKYGVCNGFDTLNRIYPRLQVGDRIWVKETWRPKGHNFPTGWPYEYRATAEQDGNPTDGPWKPSLFMPRAAARIFLLVTAIRSEKLHWVTEADAIAEGIEFHVPVPGDGDTIYRDYTQKKDKRHCLTAKKSYLSLFESLSSAEVVASNPWVTVINFQKLEKP